MWAPSRYAFRGRCRRGAGGARTVSAAPPRRRDGANAPISFDSFSFSFPSFLPSFLLSFFPSFFPSFLLSFLLSFFPSFFPFFLSICSSFRGRPAGGRGIQFEIEIKIQIQILYIFFVFLGRRKYRNVVNIRCGNPISRSRSDLIGAFAEGHK